MTEYRLAMRWRNAMAHMTALNTELMQPPCLRAEAWRRNTMRAIAESRLSNYFDAVERIIARNPISDTPGDRKRQAA